jgi:EpsI family protein
LRAFVIMYVASATGMRWLVGRDHVLFGWILFGAVIGALLWVGARFADAEVQHTPAAATASERARLWPWVLIFGLLMLAVTAQPLQTGLPSAWLWLLPAAGVLVWALYRRAGSLAAGAAVPRGIHYRTLQGGLVLGGAPGVIAAGPSLLLRPVAVDGPREPLAIELPAIDECHRGGAWSEAWLPSFRLPDTVTSGAYVCGGQDVNVFVATYSGDTQGRELISESNKAVPDAMRFRAALGASSFTSLDGREIGVNELRAGSSETPTLVWYWYRIGKKSATDPVVVKLDQALDLLLMRRTDSAVYVLETPAEHAVDTSRERLARVARELTARAASDGLPKVTLVERANTTSP